MSTEPQMTPPLEAAFLLSQTSALFARAAGRALQNWDVTWPQAMSLLVLEGMGSPISATRLVHELGLGRTAMTSVVDRLERNGWVRRQPSTIDRRTADLILTDSGRSLIQTIRPVLAELTQGTFASFKEKDLDKLNGDLGRLRGDLSTKV